MRPPLVSRSTLLVVLAACAGTVGELPDGGEPGCPACVDGGAADAGEADGGNHTDGGTDDAGLGEDAGDADAGGSGDGGLDGGLDGGPGEPDGGADGGAADGGGDAGDADGGAPDAGGPDAGPSDAGGLDGGGADAGSPDAGRDAGVDAGATDGGRSYFTDFPAVENPISEGGEWVNGGADGLSWQDIRTAQGLAYASGTSAGYNDCIAHLTGFPPDQYAEATVHVVSGYTPPSSHEVELLLRFRITANDARGYEVLAGWGGGYSQIVRWNGPLSSFTYLSTSGPGFGALAEGDVIRATAVGSTLTAYKNGVQVLQATDSTWADGDPGMGLFVRPGTGATPSSYCYSTFAAGGL